MDILHGRFRHILVKLILFYSVYCQMKWWMTIHTKMPDKSHLENLSFFIHSSHNIHIFLCILSLNMDLFCSL